MSKIPTRQATQGAAWGEGARANSRRSTREEVSRAEDEDDYWFREGGLEEEIEKLSRAAMGKDEDELRHTLNTVTSHLSNVSYNIKKELFSWVGCGFDEYFEKSNLHASIAILLMIFFYVFGLLQFTFQMQIISECDADMISVHDVLSAGSNTGQQAITTPISCKGWADECIVIEGSHLTFKGYIVYRIIAYLLLLVPFMYMPFVVIATLDGTIAKVANIINVLTTKRKNQGEDGSEGFLLEEDDPEEPEAPQRQRFKSNPKEITNRTAYVSENLAAVLQDIKREGHEFLTQVMFLVFHGGLGIFSIVADTYLVLMVIGNVEMSPVCMNLKLKAQDFSGGQLFTDWKFVGYWQLITGCVFMVMVIWYSSNQCFFCLHKRVEKIETKKHQQNMDEHARNLNRRRHRQTITHVKNLINARAKGEADKIREIEEEMGKKQLENEHLKGQLAGLAQ